MRHKLFNLMFIFSLLLTGCDLTGVVEHPDSTHVRQALRSFETAMITQDRDRLVQILASSVTSVRGGQIEERSAGEFADATALTWVPAPFVEYRFVEPHIRSVTDGLITVNATVIARTELASDSWSVQLDFGRYGDRWLLFRTEEFL